MLGSWMFIVLSPVEGGQRRKQRARCRRRGRAARSASRGRWTLAWKDVLSLRRHDPDQVQRVPAVRLKGGCLSSLNRSSPRNNANVGPQGRVSTRSRLCSRRNRGGHAQRSADESASDDGPILRTRARCHGDTANVRGNMCGCRDGMGVVARHLDGAGRVHEAGGAAAAATAATAVAGDIDHRRCESQPSTSMTRRSVGVTAFTTPVPLKARNESSPALWAQSPKSSSGSLLKSLRLVTPLSNETYPGVVPTKLRAPSAVNLNRS